MFENFIRVAAATPEIRVADCDFNAEKIIALIKKAEREEVRVICFPELCVTGNTCGDLFSQKVLLHAAQNALEKITHNVEYLLAVVGLPIEYNGKIFSAFAVLNNRKILALLSRDGISFGANLIFSCGELKLSVGKNPAANLILNPSAECEILGKSERRRLFCAAQSAGCAYVHAEAGRGESTTDMVFSAHNLICEDGEILAESLPFGEGWAVAEIDLDALLHERRRKNIFLPDENNISFSIETNCTSLTRKILRLPFVPENFSHDEVLEIQVRGLQKRLEHVGARVVLGISGGLDSTLALLVAARANAEIIAVTMPCFGTTARTKSNAHKLCAALKIPCREIDITETVRTHFRDIAQSEEKRDITYENAQARVRTMVLMNLANQQNALVVGTGSLSEIALGWATYNGDHMSMYAVNAGVPKTLAREIVTRVAKNSESELQFVLEEILNTPVSPELLPPTDGEISQQTEKILGSYELNDFFLFHALRNGRAPSQILELACVAFAEIPRDEIKSKLKLFFSRFFSQQFKRNCSPDSVKVCEISLSPRGGWNMPSDASPTAWEF